MPKPPRTPRTEILPSDKPIPPGTKRVRSTRVEEFEQPIAHVEDAPHESQLTPSLDEQEAEPADLDRQHGSNDELIDDEPLTPVDALLRSLEDTADYSLYIIRKPDPIGMRIDFREPCLIEQTKGEIPYDESYKSKESVDLVIQRLYGGGKYQIQLRQGGNYVKAWTRVVPDAPAKAETINVAPAPAIVPAEKTNPLDELRASFQIVRDFKDVLGIPTRTQSALDNNPHSLPPQSPADAARETVTMMKDMVTLAKELMPEREASGSSSGGSTLSSLLNFGTTLIRELRIGEVVGPMLAGAVAQRMNQGGNAAPTVTLQTTPPPPEPSPAQLAMLRFVRGVAADMSRSEPDALMDVDPCVQDTVALVQKFPDENKSLINDILNATAREVVQYIATLAHDATLLTHAPAEAWAADYQETLREQSGSVLLEIPALVTEPSVPANGEPKQNGIA